MFFIQNSDIYIVKASWHNWFGGQAGIAGTSYELEIILKDDVEKYRFLNLTIENVAIPIEYQRLHGDTLYLRAKEDKSVKKGETLNKNFSPKLRDENPTRAMLHYKYNNNKIQTEIQSITRGKDQFQK